MRNLFAALVIVGLLAAPSLGVINVSLVPDNANLNYGETTTVRILAQGTAAGLAALGGNINASGPGLAANAGSFVAVPEMQGTALTPIVLGAPGANGGWAGFGIGQTAFPPSSTYAKAALTEVARYTVTAGNSDAVVTLHFVGGSYGGWKPAETNKATAMGQVVDAVINVVPEPATLVLLALGGLVAARRRSH